MKYLYIFLLCLLTTGALSAQAEIVATVMDSTGTTLPGANAVLLRSSDSLLTSFGTTDNNGVFRMENVAAGDYLLRVTFLGYERPDQTLKISTDDQYLGLGDLKMYPAGFFINGVEVTADRIPIRMKGDTMLYDADAFAVGENAVVEDLIRRLPGMSVDAAGQITWRGRPINEVMINGKPFFAGNSTLLTQNLDAKAITNVEVFDQKTDAEEISGVDDGNENMTVNLEMKDEFKAKIFGEVYAGYGTSDRYQAGGKVFRISDATQIGLLGTVNNVNKVGFSGDEISGFNGSSGRGRGFSWNGPEGNLPFDNGSATGQNRSIASGINFGQSVGKNGQLTADYALFDRNQIQQSTTLEAFNRANDKRVVETMEGNATGQFSHRVGFEYRQRVDSTSRVRIKGSGYLVGGDNETQALTSVRNAGELVDDYTVRQLDNNERPGGEISLRYNRGESGGRRRGFGGGGGAPRRTFELSAEASYVENKTDLDLLTEGLNEASPSEFTGALINGTQLQNRRTNTTNLQGDVNYTEPLGMKWRMRLGAGYALDRDEGDYRFIFQEEVTPNLLNRDWSTLEGNVSFIRNVGKGGNLSFGTAYEANTLTLTENEDRTDNYNFLLPFVRLRMRTKKGFLSTNISTSSRAPSISQLQTIVEPSANGRSSVGNADLQPAMNTRFNTYLWFNDQFRAISANLNFNVTYTDDAFGNSVTFTDGQQIFKPVNVGHAWQGSAFTGATLGINAINGELRVEGRINGSRGIGFVDEVEQLNTSISTTVGANLTTELNEDSYLKVGYDLNNFVNRFEGENNGRNADVSQLTHNFLAQFELEVSPKWRFESRFLYSIFAASEFSAQQTIPDLRLSLELRPFRKKRHFFRISASDIFNQNTIINRSVNSFVTRETTSDGLGRYFLGTFHFKI
jgi:hypothetical protein